MLIRVNIAHAVSLEVKDSSNNPVSDDTVFCSIKDANTNKYFNGVTWSENKVDLSMTHIIDGVYAFKFIPDIVSKFIVTCRSVNNNKFKEEILESYSDEAPSYTWEKGQDYSIIQVKPSNVSNLKAVIRTRNSGLYYDGIDWYDSYTEVRMQEIESNIHILTFKPEQVEEHDITVLGDGVTINEIVLDVKDNGSPDSLRVVGSKTIKSPDGSDTVLMARNGIPVSGVKVTCYSGKDIVSTSQTNGSGEWSMKIKPGKYYFVFEKDGYVSVSFEREVL